MARAFGALTMLADILVLLSIYALLGAGYVIVYRSSRVLNFAYPEIFMVGAYLCFTIVASLQLHAHMIFPLGIVIGIVAGVLVYLFLMAPMAGQPVFAAVLVTIGLGTILRGLVYIRFTAQSIFPGSALGVDNSTVEVFEGLSITRYGLVMAVLSLVVITGLLLFFRYSRLGMQMRAASFDPKLAAYRGMNIHLLFALAWGISLGIGAFAGALYGMNYQIGIAISVVGIKALVVALVGGMDSLTGLIPAALIVATMEILVQRFIDPALSEVIPFIALVIILLLRPWGLLGTKEMIDRV